MPWWTQEALAARRPFLEARGRILAAIRGFFAERGFPEVETPALQISPGLEPHLTAFATALQSPWGGAPTALYLHTSPEFAMKKLVAGGMERIFQIARVFRNAERSAIHHPEFTMLEWYRAGAGYRSLMDDCEGLLRACIAAAEGWRFTNGAKASDPFDDWSRLSVAEAFAHHAGIDVLATAPDPAAPDVSRLAAAARGIGIEPGIGDSWEDVFFRIFLDRIEPHLGVGAPTILYDYPLSMAALARAKPGDPRVAERFELYVAGLELANAFGELTDPTEQRRRFDSDRAKKQARYGFCYPIDEDFLAALAHGMPDCAGIALGVDRLGMLATGAARIEDVLWAPVTDSQGIER